MKSSAHPILAKVWLYDMLAFSDSITHAEAHILDGSSSPFHSTHTLSSTAPRRDTFAWRYMWLGR